MVKSLATISRRRSLLRFTLRRNVRSQVRRLDRRSIRNLAGFRPGPDGFSQALAAFTRAIRAHRRLARLAPETFDATEVDRLARRRKEDAEWMALWEPDLHRIYGSSPQEKLPCNPAADLPQMSPRTLRAVEREYASWQFWMCAGKLAMARHQQRRPHALPSLTRVARLLEIAFDFAQLAVGSPPSKQELESSGHDQALADLERIYGDHSAPSASVPEQQKSPAPNNAEETPLNSSVTYPPALLAQQPSSSPHVSRAPVDTKRDFTPCALVVGPHGLLCLQPIDEKTGQNCA